MKRIICCLGLVICFIQSFSNEIKLGELWYDIDWQSFSASVVSNRDIPKLYSGEIVVPESIEYNGYNFPVTSIGYQAFNGCTDVVSIMMPESITTIGEYAFHGCTGIMSFSFPSSITTIGSYAFRGCTGLTTIVLPKSITEIGRGAFYDCSGLTSINLPNGIKSIEPSTFYGCVNLASITIPEGVTDIGESAFWGCEGISSVDIPNSVYSIGLYAFSHCSSLKTLTLGKNITSINQSFVNLTSLSDVTLNCRLVANWLRAIPFKRVIFGENVETIAMGVFYNRSHVVAKSLTNIPPASMEDLPFDSLEVPKGSCCNYAQAAKWNQTKCIYAVYNGEKYYPSYSVSEGIPVVGIEQTSDNNAEIKEGTMVNVFVADEECVNRGGFMVIIDGVDATKDILQDGKYSFLVSPNHESNKVYSYACSEANTCVADLEQSGTLLDFVSIDKVNEIHYLKISGDINGTDMRVINKMPNLHIIDMENASIVAGGQAYSGDNRFTSDDMIGSYFFEGLTQLYKVTLPLSAQYIANYALRNQKYLKRITIPNGITTIGTYSFQGCERLESVEILCPTVDNCFSGLTSIKHVIFGDSTSTIKAGAFRDCTGLTDVIFPANISSIERNAFLGCSNISHIISMNILPPKIAANTFENSTKQTATLTVQKGCLTDYWLAPYWSDFINIDEKDFAQPSSINQSALIEQTGGTIYDLSGKKVNNPKYNVIYIRNGKKYMKR